MFHRLSSLSIGWLSALLAILALPLSWPVAALGPLNDTGIDFCGGAASGNGLCDSNKPIGQDADYGRDAAAADGTLTKIGSGGNGFDFTKIANDGRTLPATVALGDGPGEWACTRDNVTGLLWEVKTNDGGWRDEDWTYTWHNPKSLDGNPGSPGDTGTCDNTLNAQPCNTTNYVVAVNAAKLCGYSDWRMPSVKELESIVDYGRFNPAIDPDYFPYTTSSYYWSGSVYSHSLDTAWDVRFSNGYVNLSSRNANSHVRLVRGGP
jgi:hypothetical protein